MRLVILTSLSPPGILSSLLSRYIDTSQNSAGFLSRAPLNRRFCSFSARMLLAEVVPRTNVSASMTLLFPLPFGPAITLNPSGNGIVIFPAKDLNPCIVILSNLTIKSLLFLLQLFKNRIVHERRNRRVLVLVLILLYEILYLLQELLVDSDYGHNVPLLQLVTINYFM